MEQYSHDDSGDINPFNLTSKQFKTFATLFSEALMKNTTLKSLAISCWDTLLADNHKFQKQNQQLQLYDDDNISDYENNNNNNNGFYEDCGNSAQDISLIDNSIFFKAISMNQTLVSLSLVNEVINENDLKCLGYNLLKNHSISFLNLSNNNLSDTDSLLEFLIYLNRRHTPSNNSTPTGANLQNLNLSKNIYSPISSPSLIYKHIQMNKSCSRQIILPICLEYKINILNQNKLINILFK
ncbi:expressed protein [Dictyostelium purpureum]|uniref:Expressed protein n=1 Tax=Dictyostelium purpureum TaxID=5786 RepID=F0ZEV5_DICPU|nr:uncharacterized protein DICPUDRAFT_91615 [Dictyostelium purpureum]EGC37558.1 expressed protein [Dictyostelium purpureum]|eukprot:XP_003285949.1 expressed protein [Dictyostelium purpureum]